MSYVDTSSTTASPSDGGEEDEKTDDAIEFEDGAASEYLTNHRSSACTSNLDG